MKYSEAEAALKARVVELYHEEEERLQQIGREQLDTTSQDSTVTVTVSTVEQRFTVVQFTESHSFSQKTNERFL